jgi:hypothetical protein
MSCVLQNALLCIFLKVGFGLATVASMLALAASMLPTAKRKVVDKPQKELPILIIKGQQKVNISHTVQIYIVDLLM